MKNEYVYVTILIMDDANLNIIIDCDPGIDDAIAIATLLSERANSVMLALASYGNVSLEKTARNCAALMALFNSEAPVVRGAEKPAPGNSAYEDASNVHGGDGLGGLYENGSFINPLRSRGLRAHFTGAPPDAKSYIETVYNAIISKGRVDYITLGPLTNLSELIKARPDAVGHIRRVVTMGGGFARGNVTPHAEFNIYCDAESAANVFSAFPDITLVPLDVTESVAFDATGITAITSAATPVATVMAGILEANYKLCAAFGQSGAVMHDATAVLAYLHPELFEFRTCGVRVDCQTDYGKTTIKEDGANIKLAVNTQPKRVLELITKSILGFDA